MPGMKRPANPLDVEFGLARREGLPVPFADALFLHLIPQGSRNLYEAEFAKLKGPFSFLLNHGFACFLLALNHPASS